MTRGPLTTIVRHLRRLTPPPSNCDVSDRRLMPQATEHCEEPALQTLIHQHGPMVLGVCRRRVCNAPDADDAFQATFLILRRKADSLDRRGSLASWVYRVASRARADRRRQQEHEQRVQT